MTEYSAAESKQNAILAMGDEAGAIYAELWQQVAWLHVKWSEYVALFGTKESRVVLLNKAAPAFTRMLQDCLWEDVILHIARLTDRAKTSGRSNLSLPRLVEAVGDAELRAELNKLMRSVDVATEFSRDWRNRHIAHRDLNLAMKGGDPLKPASRTKVQEALQAVANVMNTVSLHYMKSETAYNLASNHSGGAQSLLYVIDTGVKGEAARKERLQSGKYEPSDLEPRAL